MTIQGEHNKSIFFLFGIVLTLFIGSGKGCSLPIIISLILIVVGVIGIKFCFYIGLLIMALHIILAAVVARNHQKYINSTVDDGFTPFDSNRFGYSEMTENNKNAGDHTKKICNFSKIKQLRKPP